VNKGNTWFTRNPSSLRDMSSEEIAWLAGWLEGEGCFSFGGAGGKYPRISAASTDLDTLEHVLKITNVGNITGRWVDKNPNHRKLWTWTVCTANDVAPLLEAILPFMMERRAARILELLKALNKH
jgi:hypothetical protein